MQDGRTRDLLPSAPRLIAELSQVLPLLPGDVIFTGTRYFVKVAGAWGTAVSSAWDR